MSNKPKEWYLFQHSLEYMLGVESGPILDRQTGVHVVDKASYDQVCKELAEARKELADLKAELREESEEHDITMRQNIRKFTELNEWRDWALEARALLLEALDSYEDMEDEARRLLTKFPEQEKETEV